MGKYKNVHTGKVHEIDDDHYEQIKGQGNYVPAPAKKSAPKKAPAKKASQK